MASASTRMKKEIASGEPGRIYIMYGEERYLLEYQLGQLIKATVPDDFADFNLFRFDGGKLTPHELSDALESLPAFSERKLIIVTDLDLFRLSADLREQYLKVFSDIPDYATLAIVYDALEYNPDKRQNMYKYLEENALTVEFEFQDAKKLVGWLRRRADALSKQLDPSTAEHMLFICGSSMTALIQEIEKAAAYASGPAILVSDIDAVCQPTVEANVFALADAIADLDSARSLHLLRAVMSLESDPVPLFGAIGSHMRRLLAARLAIDANRSASFVSSVTGTPPFAVNRLLSTARKLPLEWCLRAVKACADCDHAFKSTSADPSNMLESLVMSLCSKETRV